MAARLNINPHGQRTIHESDYTHAELALIGGFPQVSNFSAMLASGVVPDTPQNIARWQRVADAVRFPRDQFFLNESQPNRGAFAEIPPAPKEATR